MEVFGGFEGIDLDDLVDIGDAIDITDSLETVEPINDYTMIRTIELEYPCVIADMASNAERVKSMTSGLLTPGDTQLYVRLKKEGEELGDNYLALNKIDMTPKNINILIRVALKDSVHYSRSEEEGKRLVKPEQFIRKIKIDFDEEGDDRYWEELVSSDTDTKEKDLLADFY